MNENKIKLYKKLLAIQKAVAGLGKDTTAFQYKYVGGTKILIHIKPLMNDLGLILKQEVVKAYNTRMDYVDSKGVAKSEVLTKLLMRFTWVDVDTGETDENIFVANGQNGWDKGVGSALTYGERYFLLKYFHIPTDEDDIDNPALELKESVDNCFKVFSDLKVSNTQIETITGRKQRFTTVEDLVLLRRIYAFVKDGKSLEEAVKLEREMRKSEVATNEPVRGTIDWSAYTDINELDKTFNSLSTKDKDKEKDAYMAVADKLQAIIEIEEAKK